MARYLVYYMVVNNGGESHNNLSMDVDKPVTTFNDIEIVRQGLLDAYNKHLSPGWIKATKDQVIICNLMRIV